MSQDPFGPRNPYAETVPAGPAVKTGGPIPEHLEPVIPQQFVPFGGLEYSQAFNYQFSSPNWLMNIIWGSIAFLSANAIPIVGPLVFSGYQFRVIDHLIRSNGESFPDFTFDDLEDYFLRGLWPLLVSLLASICLVPLVLIGSVAVMLVTAGFQGAQQNNDPGVLTMIAFFFVTGAMLMLYLGFVLLMTPLILRAGLGKDFGRTFNFGWCFDFVGKMWFEMVVSFLFLMVIMCVLMPLGFIACVVGLFAAASVFSFVQSHFWYQWYRLYLERGGEPILVAVKSAQPPPGSAAGFSPGPPITPPEFNPNSPFKPGR